MDFRARSFRNRSASGRGVCNHEDLQSRPDVANHRVLFSGGRRGLDAGAGQPADQEVIDSWAFPTWLFVASVGVTCCACLLLAKSDVLVWGELTRVALHTSIGFLLMGIGLIAMAWDLRLPGSGELIWIPVGASITVATARIGLWQAYRNLNPTQQESLPGLAGVLTGRIFERHRFWDRDSPGLEGAIAARSLAQGEREIGSRDRRTQASGKRRLQSANSEPRASSSGQHEP